MPRAPEILRFLPAHADPAVVRIENPIHVDAPATLDRTGNRGRKAGTACRNRYQPTVKSPNSTATVRALRANARATDAAIPADRTATGSQGFGADPNPLHTRYKLPRIPTPRIR